MPVMAVWDNEERTILRYIFEGRWTVEEFDKASEPEMSMTPSPDESIYLIADMRDGHGLPLEFLSTREDAVWRRLPHLTTMIVATPKDEILRVYDMHVRLTGNQPVFSPAQSLEEAYAMIDQHRRGA